MRLILILIYFPALVCCLTNKSDTNYDLESDKDDVRIFLFIPCCLLISALARHIIQWLNLPIPHPAWLMLFGAIWGFVASCSVYLMEFSTILYSHPDYFIITFLPILVFKTALCIDAHSFFKSWTQITVIAIGGLLLTAISSGILIMLIVDNNWTFTLGVLFGILCTPIYPLETVAALREVGLHTKYISILLEGESIVGLSTAIIVYTIVLGCAEEYITEWYHIAMVFLRFVIGGIVMGCFLGFITCFLLNVFYSDALNVLVITLVFPYLGYFLCEEIVFVSGVLCVVIIGVMISMERTALSTETDNFLTGFWKMLAYVVNSIIFFIIGMLFSMVIITTATLRDYVFILVTYMIVNLCRFMSFFLLSPLLKRIGYGLAFRSMLVMVWGGLKFSISLCIALKIFHHAEMHEIGKQFLTYLIGLYFLMFVINAPITPCLLNVMGLSEFSIARQANMNNCMKYVLAKRERAIAMLKMDRFLADANWPIVNKVTDMKHPYKLTIDDSDEEEEFFMGYRVAVCPDCRKEVLNEPTAKELNEMMKEARLRILKAQKVSYSRQYEYGLLSKDGIRILTQIVETAMDSQNAMVELDGLHKLFKKQGCMNYFRNVTMNLFFKKSENLIKPPRKYWRRISYKIIMHPFFEIGINTAVALNIVPIVLELVYAPKSHSSLDIFLKIANTIFYITYFFEFILKIYGYSWIYVCRDGFGTYFKSCWNWIDFIVLVFATGDIIMDYVDLFSTEYNKSTTHYSKITGSIKLIKVCRFLKLIALCRACYPRLIKFFDSRIDSRMAFAYDVGKGFVAGEEEVLEMLPQMIDNSTIREEVRKKIDEDRLAITKQLGMVQKDRPWIAITVKTKQAIRTALNVMQDAINELKVSGWVDDFEYYRLVESLTERNKIMRHIRSIQPSSAKVIFKEVPWMYGEERIINFLYENVTTRIFEPGDQVCDENEMPEGIFIIVTGLFLLTYIPRSDVLFRLDEYGCLPTMDYIATPKFDNKIEDYIVSGNSIGELCILTGRSYNCSIVAESHSQAYVLRRDVIMKAMEMSCDPVNGLECKMWKSLSVRMAVSILMEVPAYQSSTANKIRYALERAFVPNLSNYKIFVVNDMMEDIILIEGIVVDFNTRDCYTAPCYIPRTVQKLMLPKSSQMNIEGVTETKLLIIPTKDVDEYDIMEVEEEISELVEMSSSKCLQHLIQGQPARLRKKRRKAGIILSQRRVRMTQSHSTTAPRKVHEVSSMANSNNGTEMEMQSINMQ